MRLTPTDFDAANFSRTPTASSNRRPLESTPSRHSNPFATCWTRPGAIPFQFFDGASAERLIQSLARQSWRGQILGPHGSGKSTLLATLIPHLKAAGPHVVPITLRNGQRRLPRGATNEDLRDDRRKLLIIDGYEQLGWLERLRVQLPSRRTGDGLLVTSHRCAGLPTLVELSPGLAHVCVLASVLCGHRPRQISYGDLAASYARCGSNVREIFFELYDRHEAIRRRGTMS